MDNPQLSIYYQIDESSTTIDQLMYSRNPVQLVSRVQLIIVSPCSLEDTWCNMEAGST